MVVYTPILKSRAGEMSAIRHLAPEQVAHLLPIVEVVPSGSGRTVEQFLSRAARFPNELRFGLDLRHVLGDGGGALLLRELAAGLPMLVSLLPVVHLDDDPALLAEAADTARRHADEAIVRLPANGPPYDDIATQRELDRLCARTGLAVEQCHLLIDADAVASDRDVSVVEPEVRKRVSWAKRFAWRSIIVAAGAMPGNVRQAGFRTPTPVHRWDLELWNRVRDLGVRYADYGIAHPGPVERGWRPPPNLRYTDDEVWWVYRWPGGEAARATMRELCRVLTHSEHWPSDGESFSWGDERIAACAAGRAGPGNATSWRAWGTSHHLAHVVARLPRTR